MADETISEKCETLYNKLNTFVASVISRDVTPKISNLNTEVWGSDTQTGSSRIDTLNTNFNNLDSSITSMESDINNVESDVSNLQTSVNSLNTSITNLVTVERVSLVKTNANLTNHSSVDLTATITIPSGYKVLDYYTRNYTGVTDVSRLELNGTTLSVRGWNHTGQTQSNVYIYVGVLYIRDL